MWEYHSTDCLVHHGIKGQKWGVRRYQNEDGTLTEAGRKRYGYSDFEKSKASVSEFRSSVYADKAARKMSKAKMHGAVDASGKKLKSYAKRAKQFDIRSGVYGDLAKEKENRGDLNLAIKMQAVSNNNRQISKEQANISKATGFLDRYYAKKSNDLKRYSYAGREYLFNKEYMLNQMTLGLYSPIADSVYRHKYSESERLERLRKG